MNNTETSIDKNKIRKELKRVLDKKRYIHSMGVANTAIALAMRYGENLEQAELAGMLHDCAKCEATKDIVKVCESHQLPIREVERRNPSLLHTKLGAYFAEHTYGITDELILDAIRYHTTGRPNMTMLEKVIFVADYIEPNRISAPNLTAIRKMAFVDIEQALMMILKDTLVYLESSEFEIDDMTRETYQFYKQQEQKESN